MKKLIAVFLCLSIFALPLQVQSARNFDGVDDKVDMGDVLDFTSASMTLLAWIRPNNDGEAGSGQIIDKHNGIDANGYGWNLTFSSTYKMAFWCLGSSALSNTIPSFGTWWHAAVSYNGSNASFYINGDAAGSPAYTNVPTANTTSLVIGNTGGQTRTFNGVIAEVALYNVPLTQTEIQAAMRLSYPRINARVGYWRIFGTSSPEPDLSGSAFNGTVTGTTYYDHPPGISMDFFERVMRNWLGYLMRRYA